MKVVLVNGSRRDAGCTYTALSVVAKELEAQGIDTEIVARRDFLPKFVLYGQAGFSAYNLTNIFGNHTFKSALGFMPVVDLFTGGAKMAHLKYTKLELEKAKQIYEKTVLTSIQEVNNSLGGAITRDLNYKESVKRYNLEKDKFALADKKYNIGAKSKLDRMKDREKLLVAEKDFLIRYEILKNIFISTFKG